MIQRANLSGHDQRRRLAIAIMPAVFVVLWSTGFIGAKYGLPYAPPLLFLTLRFIFALAVLLPIAWALGARWPSRAGLLHSVVVGVLVHGLYLGGVYVAIARGLPAGLAALIVCLQPILTAIAVGPLLGERIGARRWLGLALGLAGVAAVLAPSGAGLDAWAVGLAVAALCGITAGMLYQKRFGAGIDLIGGTAVQYVAALATVGVAALAFEPLAVDWTAEFVFALTWLTLVVSIGAISLLTLLIRMGEAARTASLFYLVPPVTALMAWAMFGEELGGLGIAGLAVTAVGVALARTTAGRADKSGGGAS